MARHFAALRSTWMPVVSRFDTVVGHAGIARQGLLQSVVPVVTSRQSHSLVELVQRVEHAGQPARTNWVFLGPNGVGKGTYAKKVAELVGIPHISTGDLVRERIEQDAEFSAQVG